MAAQNVGQPVVKCRLTPIFPHQWQFSDESEQFVENPIPGADVGGDAGESTQIPQKQAFTANNQTLSNVFQDTPYDLVPRWYTTNGQFQYQDPLVSAQREDQFMTWLYAQNRVTGQICYLKWVQWQISYKVNFDFTKATPDSRTTWLFKEISEGSGMGPMAPNHTPFNETIKIQKNQ